MRIKLLTVSLVIQSKECACMGYSYIGPGIELSGSFDWKSCQWKSSLMPIIKELRIAIGITHFNT